MSEIINVSAPGQGQPDSEGSQSQSQSQPALAPDVETATPPIVNEDNNQANIIDASTPSEQPAEPPVSAAPAPAPAVETPVPADPPTSGESGQAPPEADSPGAYSGETGDFLPAVFIGWGGFNFGQDYTFPSIWPLEVALSTSGKIIPTLDENGAYANPEGHPEFKCWTKPVVTPGEVVPLPLYSPDNFMGAVNNRQFAKLEWADRIQGWYKEGIRSQEIYRRVREGNGLIEPLPGRAAVYASDQRGG